MGRPKYSNDNYAIIMNCNNSSNNNDNNNITPPEGSTLEGDPLPGKFIRLRSLPGWLETRLAQNSLNYIRIALTTSKTNK